MPSLPLHDPEDGMALLSPHVVLLGAGASVAACPRGDRNGRKLPVMANLAGIVGLADLLEGVGLDPTMNFEDSFTRLSTDPSKSEVVEQLETRIRDYFRLIEIPDEVTAYDQLLASLRSKDVIATFNWDPLLAQAYSRNRHLDLPSIVFLHGNVAVAYCLPCRQKGWSGQRCVKCDKPMELAPLLYPIGEKNYESNGFIKNEWSELRHYLRKAYYFTLFGYGAPETDVAARSLLLETWRENPHFKIADVEIIDIDNKRNLVKKWGAFFVRDHYRMTKSIGRSYLCRHPRRSCEAHFQTFMMCNPWPEDNLPKYRRLDKLRSWASPYLQEERAKSLSGLPRCGHLE